MSEEARCGRRNNIRFNQQPELNSPKKPNGEHTKFALELTCDYCGFYGQLHRLSGKQCQWWINIANMKHNTCHMEVPK